MCRKSNHLISFVLLLSIVLAGAAQAELVGWWRLDDGAGTTAIDSSAGGNDGTFQGTPQWVAGKVGGALAFDGGDSVNVPGATDIKPESVTLMTWVSFDSVAGGRQDYLSKDDDYALSLHENSADQKIHGIVTSAGAWPVVHGSTVVEIDTWYHTALTYDSSTQMLILYLDGEVDAEMSVTTGLEHRRGGPLTLGTFSGRDLFGRLDDVKIFDHAMSEVEIKGAMSGKGFPNAYGPSPADGAIHEATWATLGWRPGDFAVSHDVYLGDNFDDVDNGAPETFRGNQSALTYIVGFVGFAYPDGLVPGTTYYWRIDEVNDADPNSPWKGDIWSFSIPARTAYNPDPADGAGFVDLNTTLGWAPGFDAKLHHVYFGDSYADVNDGTGGAYKGPAAMPSYNPGTLEAEKVYYWRVDEFDPPFTHKGDVWGFTTPGAVGNPQPANGAMDVQMIATLNWTPADNATSHELYFGADADAVRNATTTSPEYIGPRSLGSESYDPGGLAWDSSYAWRVDEVYPTETIKGLVWSFATADFIGVDDFESYNDVDPPDPASNRIFEAWLDGFGTTTNGALVGNDLPPYAEQTIVHGGSQSMPYLYDNNFKVSEATLTLVYPRDWTEQGVTKLVLWFRGGSANSAERMFVALNGAAVVYHADATVTQMTGWNRWVIDLQEFVGVNLTNVNMVTIGIGTKGSPVVGGTGQMYFDDIGLYR